MSFLDKAKGINEYVVNWRRHFHENPELSNEEHETIAALKKELDNLGVEYVEIEDGGILGTITGNKEGNRSVLLRADVDALPVLESDKNLAVERVVKSKVDGVMHACGHDGHMAMLLGAAKVLMDMRDDFGGKVYLCFERGEEGTGNYRYIMPYLEKNGIVPDTVWAVHLQATIETGKVAIADGPMMAAAQGFDIELEGQGGHGSRPDESNSPIDGFIAIYNALSELRMREIDPFETLTYSVGRLTSGHVANVIPQTLRFSGTARFLDRDKAGVPFYDGFKKKIEKIAEAYDLKVTYHSFTRPGFPVVNDKDAAVFAREVLAKDLGEENVLIPEPWMASESYASYLFQWPGVFAFVGMNNPEKGIGAAHHNERFDIDEDVLKLGVAGAASYAFNFLNSDLELEDRPYKGKFKDYLRDSGISEEDIKKFYKED